MKFAILGEDMDENGQSDNDVVGLAVRLVEYVAMAMSPDEAIG